MDDLVLQFGDTVQLTRVVYPIFYMDVSLSLANFAVLLAKTD